MRKLKEDKKGFTLVELIIAMAILAILVGLLVPNVIRYIEKARESKDESALDTYYTAATTALADEKAYDAVIKAMGTNKEVSVIVNYKDGKADVTDASSVNLINAAGDFVKEFTATVGVGTDNASIPLNSKQYKNCVLTFTFTYNDTTNAIRVKLVAKDSNDKELFRLPK